MKAIITAGGFAKRLYPLTENTPKPLLDVGGKPIINHIMERIEKLPVDMVYVSTNQKFGQNFREWLASSKWGKPVKLIVEPATTEDKKMGALGALHFLISSEKIDDDILVVAGDNLFTFDITGFVRACSGSKNVAIGVYDVKSAVQAKKLGTVRMEGNKIAEFWEKSETPKSTLASTGIYYYPRGSAKRMQEYLAEGNNPDAPGFFLQWLHKRDTVLGVVFNRPEDKWFDIGSFEALDEARREFGN